MIQIPRGDPSLTCPLHKLPMDEVCHKCPWWLKLRGSDKNTGEEVDHWLCALPAIARLTMETASVGRAAGSETEELRKVFTAALARPPAVAYRSLPDLPPVPKQLT